MKSGIFTCFFAALLMFWLPVQSQNLLADGDFSSTAIIDNYGGFPEPGKWFQLVVSADANAVVTNEVCEFHVNYPGSDNWMVQLIQGGFNLELQHAYRLSFDVKADIACGFGVFLGENEGSWTSLVGYDRYWQSAGTDWTTITLDFNVPCTFSSYKFSLEMGIQSGNTLYFDNISLTDLGTYEPSIGMLGTAVNGGWDVDVNMETADGIHFTINDFPLSSGYMKFRQDDNWCINWGSKDFPAGIGFQAGPDIPVLYPGIYDITFNRETGEYLFTCVSNCVPYIGVIGSAVPPLFGSEPDVDMQTDDGVTYKLMLTEFADGGLKFRQENSWDINWGGTDFPDGVAIPDGPEIPVQAGSYTLTFNISTGEYHFKYPDIGILGSALNGWTDDVDMQTVDGVVYTLADYPFMDGEVKFRAENDWSINWGGYEFPSGYGWLNGPNIPMMAGTYNVTFNRVTGEYFFEATSCPVANIQCPYDLYLVTNPGSCELQVFYPDVKAAANCGGEGITIQQIEGLPSGSVFPVGQTLNSFMLTNSEGNTTYCSFYVNIMDWMPPVITMNTESIEPLWPPDHQMVNFYIDYSVSDDCTEPNSYLYVWSSEPEITKEMGDKSPDWEIVDEHNVLLRAERSAKGAGREYYIYVIAYDGSWNYDVKMLTVKVPHDLGIAVDKLPVRYKSAIIETGNVATSLAEIWPNPSESAFNLKVNGAENGTFYISVADVTGRITDILNMKANETIRIGEAWKSGVYIVSVRNGAERQFIRVVKTQ